MLRKTKVIKGLMRPATQGQLHRNLEDCVPWPPCAILIYSRHLPLISPHSCSWPQLAGSMLIVLVVCRVCWVLECQRYQRGWICLNRAWNAQKQIVSHCYVAETRTPADCQKQRYTEVLTQHPSGEIWHSSYTALGFIQVKGVLYPVGTTLSSPGEDKVPATFPHPHLCFLARTFLWACLHKQV